MSGGVFGKGFQSVQDYDQLIGRLLHFADKFEPFLVVAGQG